jgi:uncharacterized membrane protein
MTGVAERDRIMICTAKCIYGKKRSYLNKAEIMGVRPAKRAGVLEAMLIVVLLVSLAMLPAVSALPQAPRVRPDPAPDPASSRASAVEDKLFLRTNGTGGALTMSTVAGTGGSLRALPVEAALPNGLNASVEVVGKDMTQGAVKGMWLWFELRGVPQLNTITIQIMENDAVIANGSMQLGSATGVKRWDVPFVSGESHTFPKGAVIKVRVSSSLPGTTMQVNSAECYLLMPMTAPPVTPAVATFYSAGRPTTEFHPNWPDSVRKVITEGDIVSLFGPSDIPSSGVQVTIRNPSGDIASNGTATLSGAHYSNTWSYARGQVPGNYNVTVRVVDQQGHEYFASMTISMLRYAVFVSSPQQDADEVIKGAASPPKGGSQGKDAVYSLLVLNSGYSDTTVTMRVSSDPPPGWSATLSSTSLATIAPGATSNVTLTVIPGAEVDYGNRAVIYIEAVSDSDTRTPKASWTVQTVTNATMSRTLDFSLNSPSDVSVDISQKATFQMLARNKGVLDMNVTFSHSGVPFGWDAVFTDVGGMVHLDTGANSEKTVTLVVTAPSEEVANISRVAQLTVTAQVLEDASLEKRITTITRLITILGLTVDKTSQTCDPGGKVDFRATISNMDPAVSHPVRITVTPPAEWPLTSISFSPRETNLGANTSTTIIITVMPPATAEANLDSGYTLTIKAEPTDQPTRSNSTAIVVKLRANVNFEMTLSSASREATPGAKVTLQLTVKNLGNSNINVVIFVAADIPQDWKVHLNDGTTDVLSPPNPLTVSLAPSGRSGATQVINLTIQPSSASRSDTAVKITLTATAGTDVKKSSSVQVTVKKDLMARLRDAIMDSALVIVFCILVLLVFAVLLRRNARPAKR